MAKDDTSDEGPSTPGKPISAKDFLAQFQLKGQKNEQTKPEVKEGVKPKAVEKKWMQKLFIAMLIFISVASVCFAIYTSNKLTELQEVKEVVVTKVIAQTPPSTVSAVSDSDAKNRADIEKAKAELEVAKLKAEAASYQAKKSVKTPALVVDVSTFGCSTIERLYNGFANAPTVDGAQGTQLMVTDGCANIRFDHEITSLEGIGYAVTFDPVNSPNPQRCGNGAQGKDDAPSTCLAYINSNIGRTLHVLVNKNSFLKLGD